MLARCWHPFAIRSRNINRLGWLLQEPCACLTQTKMKTYLVDITETAVYKYRVQADTEERARETAEQDHDRCRPAYEPFQGVVSSDADVTEEPE